MWLSKTVLVRVRGITKRGFKRSKGQRSESGNVILGGANSQLDYVNIKTNNVLRVGKGGTGRIR